MLVLVEAIVQAGAIFWRCGGGRGRGLKFFARPLRGGVQFSLAPLRGAIGSEGEGGTLRNVALATPLTGNRTAGVRFPVRGGAGANGPALSRSARMEANQGVTGCRRRKEGG